MMKYKKGLKYFKTLIELILVIMLFIYCSRHFIKVIDE